MITVDHDAPFKNKNSRSTYQNPFQILNHKCHTAKHPEQKKDKHLLASEKCQKKEWKGMSSRRGDTPQTQ